jgi:RNA polymerase sigma factor (sigma-70 family)
MLCETCYVIPELCYTCNMDNISDEKLVSEYLSGDEKSLEILVGRYLKSIYNFLLRFVNDPSSAEDNTQEVFVKVWKNLKKFDQSKSFKPWIFRIAKNTALDHLRQKKILVFSELGNEEDEINIIENIPDPAPMPDEIFDRQNLKNELQMAIDKLPLNYKIVVMLHGLEELTFQEISETLEEPLNTVKSRYLRALVKLREILIK